MVNALDFETDQEYEIKLKRAAEEFQASRQQVLEIFVEMHVEALRGMMERTGAVYCLTRHNWNSLLDRDAAKEWNRPLAQTAAWTYARYSFRYVRRCLAAYSELLDRRATPASVGAELLWQRAEKLIQDVRGRVWALEIGPVTALDQGEHWAEGLWNQFENLVHRFIGENLKDGRLPVEFHAFPEPEPVENELQTRGALIRRLREAAGLTQQQFADQTSVDVSTVQRHEAGRTRIRPANWDAYLQLFRKCGVWE